VLSPCVLQCLALPVSSRESETILRATRLPHDVLQTMSRNDQATRITSRSSDHRTDRITADAHDLMFYMTSGAGLVGSYLSVCKPLAAPVALLTVFTARSGYAARKRTSGAVLS